MRNAITLTTILAIGLIASTAFAWEPGFGMHHGYGYQASAETSPEFSAFMDETRDLHKEYAVAQAELNAVMAQTNPDPDEVASLTEKLIDTRSAINNKAEEMGVATDADWTCPGFSSGYHMSGYHNGYHMNGHWF